VLSRLRRRSSDPSVPRRIGCGGDRPRGGHGRDPAPYDRSPGAGEARPSASGHAVAGRTRFPRDATALLAGRRRPAEAWRAAGRDPSADEEAGGTYSIGCRGWLPVARRRAASRRALLVGGWESILRDRKPEQALDPRHDVLGWREQARDADLRLAGCEQLSRSGDRNQGGSASTPMLLLLRAFGVQLERLGVRQGFRSTRRYVARPPGSLGRSPRCAARP